MIAFLGFKKLVASGKVLPAVQRGKSLNLPVFTAKGSRL